MNSDRNIMFVNTELSISTLNQHPVTHFPLCAARKESYVGRYIVFLVFVVQINKKKFKNCFKNLLAQYFLGLKSCSLCDVVVVDEVETSFTLDKLATTILFVAGVDER